MTDIVSKEKRSWNMSRIKGKDTSIELITRKYLFAQGFRFRKNDKRYPGHPDIVLPKYRTVVFIHGCFFHRHQGCRYAYTPKSNTEFWNRKFADNVARDKKEKKVLEDMGWHVIIVWECELKKEAEQTERLKKLAEEIKNNLPEGDFH